MPVRNDPLEKFLRHLERLHQARRMFPAGHGHIARAAKIAARSLKEWGGPVRMSLVGEDLVVEDKSVLDFGDRLRPLAALLKKNGWEGVRISASCESSDLLEWIVRSQSGVHEPYVGGGVVAGRLVLGNRVMTGDGEGRGSGGRDAGSYASDANEALEQLDRLNPAALEVARRIVRGVSEVLALDGGLLKAVRRLKDFDEYTHTHALNVSILALAMARQLGLPQEMTEFVALGALCHDVGKAKVPREILNKPGKLDAEEWQVMKRHPAEGAKTLLSLYGGVNPLVSTIVYEHHMGADGRGYPVTAMDGAPHPASLLVQVADIFDALRTKRPYRNTMSETQAVNILLDDANAGKLGKDSVAALVGALGLLVRGTPFRLSDGRTAVVMAAAEGFPLQPLVETDEGEILDLCDPSMPTIAQLLDRPNGDEWALSASEPRPTTSLPRKPAAGAPSPPPFPATTTA